MNRWRTLTLLILLTAPILLFVGVGAWSLWKAGHLLWLWMALPAGWGSAFLLARRWRKKLVPLEPPQMEPSLHWTPRDKQAWELVETRIRTADDVSSEDLTTRQFYLDTARDLSEEIARHYHPKASDPFGSLTIPEIMAAAQLALEDLSEIYGQYVPGGQLITVDNWRSLAKLPKRYRMVSNIATAATALFSPLAAAGRYVASKTVLAPVTKAIQSNLLAWFYTSFLQRVGFYTIEMNSGRLRGGSKKYREAFARLARSNEKPGCETAGVVGERESDRYETDAAADIAICLLGQAGSGKSSLVKALAGESPGEFEILAKTSAVRSFRLRSPDTQEGIVLFDTPGYGTGEDAGIIEKDVQRALTQSDLVLLVMNVTGSAHGADVSFLNGLTAWYEENPNLKPPPVIAVLTHIDMLRPVMEWSPPYDWRNPTGRKEETIAEAVKYNRRELGGRVKDVVPVCADFDNGRVYGFQDWLLPAIAASLDEARACGMLRDLHADLDTGRVHRVLEQVWNIGKALRGR